ncbi:MAG: hypothetical protein MI924_38295 [Chloroflexales bacterium]|nr:hypothetical protein [Chloroflexales bacterium]
MTTEVWRWLMSLLGLYLLFVGLVSVNLLALQAQQNRYDLDLGTRADLAFVENLLGWETDSLGETYRWTSSQSAVHFRSVAALSDVQLVLSLGGLPAGVQAPRLVELQLNDRPWATLPAQAEPRRYVFLLPAGALQNGDLRVTVSSEVSRVPPDRRDVGIRLDAVSLEWSADGLIWPNWRSLFVQVLTVLATLLIVWRFGVLWRGRIVISIVLVLLIGWMVWHDAFLAAMWVERLFAASLLGWGIAWGLLTLLRRLLPDGGSSELRWLGIVMLIAVGTRLGGVFYPLFVSHDLYIHTDRLFDVLMGQLLLFDRPAEFNERIAIVPTAFYVLVAPLTLLTSNMGVAIQGFYAALDGLAALLVAILVRRMGGSRRAGLLAACIIAVLPIQFTALWWGFGPQIIGQWLSLAVFILAMVQPDGQKFYWISAAVVLCLMLLMHNGSAILGGFGLLGYLALIWMYERQDVVRWRGWGAILIASSLVAVLLLYLDVVLLQLREFARAVPEEGASNDALRMTLIGGGLQSSFRPIGLLLTVMSLGFLLRQTQSHPRRLVSAWLVSACLFLGVDVFLGLQVRYAYFTIPLVCAGLALLLDQLMTRRVYGTIAGWCVIAFISFVGLSIWYAGSIEGVKPTLTALTH